MEFIIAIVILIITALTVLYLLINKTTKGKLINEIPGPPSLPIIGNGIDVSVPLDELWGVLRKFADQYYPIFKFWLFHWPIVILRHPDDIKVLLSSQRTISKSFLYDLLHPWLGEGIFTSTGSKWRQRRKMLTPAFHIKLLQDFFEVFIASSERMVKSLKEEDSVIIKDVLQFFAKCTLNVICETAMGAILHDNEEKLNEYTNAVRKIGEVVYYRATRPWLKNDWIFSLTPEGREHAKDIKIIHSFTVEMIEKRKQFHVETKGKYLNMFSLESNVEPHLNVPNYELPQRNKRLVMIDLLIASQKEHGTIDDPGLYEEGDSFIFGGHDTIGLTLSFAVLLLAENKTIQEQARTEFDNLLEKSNGVLKMADLQNMQYLDRCIKETLRLYPAVPLIGRNLTEDLHLKKYTVPSGTSIGVSIYDIHRDPNFWSDPEVFDPDRFLPERMQGRHPYSYISFSAGPRNCLGQKFAILELKVYIGMLLHNFYLEPMVKTSTIHIMPDVLLSSLHPLPIKFTPIVQ